MSVFKTQLAIQPKHPSFRGGFKYINRIYLYYKAQGVGKLQRNIINNLF